MADWSEFFWITKCNYPSEELDEKRVDTDFFRNFLIFNSLRLAYCLMYFGFLFEVIKFEKKLWIILLSIGLVAVIFIMILNCVMIIRSFLKVLKRVECKVKTKVLVISCYIPIINFIAVVIFYIKFKRVLSKKGFLFLKLKL